MEFDSKDKQGIHVDHIDRIPSRGTGYGESVSSTENKLTVTFFMIMVGMSMTFIVAEVTPLILTSSFAIIAQDLNALDKVVWLVIAPFITTGAIAPFVGNISDLLGRRRLLLASLLLSTVSFIISGVARSFAVYLLGQCLSGVAIGVQALTVIAAASELVPAQKRPAVIGYIVAGFIPFLPAPLYGQLLVERSWRFIFVILGVWSLLAALVIFAFYHPPPRTNSAGLTKTEMLRRIDYVGAFLSTSGITLFVVGINWGGDAYAWRSAPVILAITLGLVLLIVFGCYESLIVKHPMFPSRIIQSKRMFIGVIILCLTSGINFIPVTLFWTLQVYSVYGDSFRMAGVHLLPIGFCIVGGAFLAATLMTFAKRQIMWILLLFCAMQTIGIACMSVFDRNNINSIMTQLVFGLFGVGGVLLPSQILFSAISPDDLLGTSVALSLVVRMVGQVVGKAMFFNIFVHQLLTRAPLVVGIPAIQAGFGGADLVARVTLFLQTMLAGPTEHYWYLFPEIKTEAALKLITDAGHKLYTEVYPRLYLISIPFGAVATVSCLMLWGIDTYMDDRVAVHLGH